MAKSIKGTQTEKNLLTSFANESQASLRYSYYAGQAKKDGYVQIEAFFNQTSEQERAHAKRFFKFLEGGEVEINFAFPALTMNDTLTNLDEAAKLEHEEMSSLYPGFAKVAEEEGFKQIASVFSHITVAEHEHEKGFREFYNRIKEDVMFESKEEIEWTCRKCGYVHKGLTPPKVCPACAHPQDHFQRKSDCPLGPLGKF